MKNGETRRGPFSFSRSEVSAMPEPADAGADEHAGALLLLAGRRLVAGVGERLVGGGHRVDDEVVDLALLLRLHPVVGVELAVAGGAARDEAGDLAGDVGDVELLDPARAALGGEQAPTTSPRRRSRAA